ncbi:MAG: cyclic pyranopterin monophosphate synthase MoaC, partial [Deltaproteobacteria bacterium]
CHPLNVTGVEITFHPVEEEHRIEIESQISLKGQTGVEMEALVAVAAAALTIYDMCKAVDREMIISDIRLVEKKGGKSGHFYRENT